MTEFNFKFSKGPWTFGRKSKYKQRVDANNSFWTSFCSIFIGIKQYPEESEEGLANARLIKHAPEMVDLLVEINRDLESLNPHYVHKKIYDLLKRIESEQGVEDDKS